MVTNNPDQNDSTIRTEVMTQDSLLKYCSVSLTEVISKGKRLEASVHGVEAKQARDLIAKNKYGTVSLYDTDGIIDTAFYPGRFKRIYCDKENGDDFFLPSQIMDIYPKPEKYISRLTKCNFDELRLKSKTLLLTRSGTVGNVSYVSDTINNCIFSDDVIRITFKLECDLGYVYAFLKSKVGNLILRTNGYGSVITHIEPAHLAEIRIPDAPSLLKSQINDLIVRSYALRDESNRLIDDSTRLLLNELNLPPIRVFKDDTRSVNTFSVKMSNLRVRLDASYHVPIVDAILTHLKKYAAEVTTVGDPRISKDVILPGRFKRIYVDEGCGRVFIGGKQIGALDPTDKKYLSLAHHAERIERELELHENMTLITCSGTVGKVVLVGKQWEKWTANQHIIRVVPANNDIAGYINVFLASDYGHQLIVRHTYGSVVDEIDDTHVKEIPIPLLKNQEVQHRINHLVLEANNKRYEAYMLEQEALRIMNEEVIFAKP